MKNIKKLMSFVIACLMIFPFVLGAAPVKASFSGDDRIVIALDPGHGGTESGAASNGLRESTLNLRLARSLKAYLEETGSFVVYLTRDGETTLTRAQRAAFGNSVNADLVLSIHFNSNASSSANGVCALSSVLPKFQMDSLGYMVLANLQTLGFNSEGIIHRADTVEWLYWNEEKQWNIKDSSLGTLGDYYGIQAYSAKFGMKSLTIEHGYLSNAHDRALISSDGMIERLARADADALIAYYTNHTHTYGEKTVDIPSNCTLIGKESNHCTVCYHRKNVTALPAAPDNHYYYVKSSNGTLTCTQDASVTYVCRIAENLNAQGLPCEQHSYTDVSQKATGHNYVVTYHRDVGHVEDGITVTTCTKCKDSYRDVVKAPGHTWVFTGKVDPTCTVDGYNSYKCSVCGETKNEAIEAPGHSYRINAVITAPTCTEGGQDDVTCTVCSYSTLRDLDALGHDFERTQLISSADCVTAGAESVKCRRCALELDREIPALGHKGKIIKSVKSTCSVQGYDRYYCSRCKTYYEVNTEMPPHTNEIIGETPSTCTAEGYTEYECSVCKTVTKEAIAILPHTFEETDRLEATCELDGYIVTTCSSCGLQETEVLPGTGHAWDEGFCAVKTGFFRDGSNVFTCQNDSSHIREEVLSSVFSSNKTVKAEFVGLVVSVVLSVATALILTYKKTTVKSIVRKVYRIRLKEAPVTMAEAALEIAENAIAEAEKSEVQETETKEKV